MLFVFIIIHFISNNRLVRARNN